MIFKKHTKPILIKNCKKKRNTQKKYTSLHRSSNFYKEFRFTIFNRMSFLNKKDTHGIRVNIDDEIFQQFSLER